jgi:Flp pilus assembly protein TadD
MNNYAVRCVENSLWEEARIWLERAKALNPDCANVYNNLGVVYEHFKLTESAKEAYKKAIELNPKEKIYKQNLELLEEFLRKKEKNEEEKR